LAILPIIYKQECVTWRARAIYNISYYNIVVIEQIKNEGQL